MSISLKVHRTDKKNRDKVLAKSTKIKSSAKYKSARDHNTKTPSRKKWNSPVNDSWI